MTCYRDLVLGQLEENLNLNLISEDEFKILKEKHLDDLSHKMSVYVCDNPDIDLEKEMTHLSILTNEVLLSVNTEMRIVFKSRVPLPHLKQSNIIESGLFNVGGFRIKLGEKEAKLDWDNSMIAVNFDQDDHLVLMGNLFAELDEKSYQELNEDVENLIPYSEVYSFDTLRKATFTEFSYEAYKRNYDEDIIPMDVVFVNFARVLGDDRHSLLGMGRVLEDVNYDECKLHEYNEREDVKWRLEGVKDPKTIHNTMGVYTHV